MGIKVSSRGDFKKTETSLKKMQKVDLQKILERYGRVGVNALSSATPLDSGVSAGSWDFTVESGPGWCEISWININTFDGRTPIVILLQYGHGTGTGGYVQGRDFINQAISPIFDKIDEEVWKAVTSA